MSTNLVLKYAHNNFLFSSSNRFNAFNLVRLIKSLAHDDEIYIDLRGFSKEKQENILTKFSTVLRLVTSLLCKSDILFILKHSTDNNSLVEKVLKETGGERDECEIIFEVSKLPSNSLSVNDPHTVKNIRGAVLLSLVDDLVTIRKIENNIDFFTEKSAITLHAASAFLSNNENAELMWRVLEQWKFAHDKEHNQKLNFQLHECLRKRARMLEKAKSCLEPLSKTGNVGHLVNMCQSKFGLSKTVFQDADQLVVWMVDDQCANGWGQLINSMLQGSNILLETFSSSQDVIESIKLTNLDETAYTPHLALVDLRLTKEDEGLESYNSKDLSGFSVVTALLEQWRELPIMITSASNKLWNLEKAIQKGASAYWRKSDEIDATDSKEVISTALDIYIQFVDKFELSLSKIKYRNLFKIYQILISLCENHCFTRTSLKRCIFELNQSLASKVTWLLWQRGDEQILLDSLLLDTMAIFNELEPLLWDRETEKLILFPNNNVSLSPKGKDNQIINQTLKYLDEKHELSGIALEATYEHCKKIRNKLNVIHGSEADNTIKQASIKDIESALLTVWAVMTSLSQHYNNS